MKVRKLEEKDAPFMLEWMHDEDVVKYMSANFTEKTIDDCRKFISFSNDTNRDLNLAIVNESDEYMGTVSLKHINLLEKTAEFAITVRKIAMGKGYSSYGMKEIIRIGLEEFGLRNIYWCVQAINVRAVKFYDKNGYKKTEDIPEHILKEYTKSQIEQFVWYVVD